MKNLLSLVLAALLLISCGSDQEINDTKIFLNFSHHVDGNPVSMDDLSHTNLAGENYNVLTLKYLISDIKLISNEKDHEKIIKDIHFVDLSDPSSMVIESDIIENGSYTLQFRFGLDATTNVTNSFVNETFHTSMSWPAPASIAWRTFICIGPRKSKHSEIFHKDIRGRDSRSNRLGVKIFGNQSRNIRFFPL